MKSSKNKSVLFLALSGIGNLVMQLPAIAAVKKEHPHWHITVWVAPRGTKDLAHSQPYIDEVLEMPIKTGVLRHIKNLLLLQRKKFDIAVVLSPGQLVKSAAYLFLSGIPTRIGSAYPFRGEKNSKLFLTQSIIERVALHDIEKNLELVSSLCETMPSVENYHIAIPDKNIQEARLLFSGNTPYIGIHAGSAKGFEWKRWPIDQFAEVAHVLFMQDSNTRFVIFGSHSEQFAKQELVDAINNLCGAVVATNITASLMTTAAAIQACCLFLSNDSGLMHIASAVGVPTIGLFGPTDERETGPRGKQSFVVRATGTKPLYNTEYRHDFGTEPHPTMLAITPGMVIDNIPTNVL